MRRARASVPGKTFAIASLLMLASASGGAQARERTRPEHDPAPSPCIADASLRLTAIPASVIYGQSSQLSWSVVLPRNCTGVSITLGCAVVGRNGSRVVAPSTTAQYRLVASQTRLGVRSQTSVSAQVSYAKFKLGQNERADDRSEILAGLERTGQQALVEAMRRVGL